MTPTQAKELLPVLAAYAEGKVVQWRSRQPRYCDEWLDYDPQKAHPTHTIDHKLEWRVKPSPRDWWLCPSCLQGFVYSEKEHRNTFQCARCSVNVVRVREVVA